MQDASGADFTDLNRSAHLPSSIAPAMFYRRHTFPRSSLIPANQLAVRRAFAPVVISSARRRLVSENFPRVAAGEPAVRRIALAGICNLVTCAFVIRDFKTK
jgi:hypothetical protein